MILNKFFPSIIGADVNKNHDKIQQKIVERCYDLKNKVNSGGDNWISSDTYNTLGKYDLFSDYKFLSINDYVINRVKNYCEQLQFQKDFLDFQNSLSVLSSLLCAELRRCLNCIRCRTVHRLL